MSYVSAIYDKNKDIVQVVERTKEGNRKFIDYPAEYTLYYQDPNGPYTSIYGDKLQKFSTDSNKQYAQEKKIRSNQKLFESDFNPIQRCLSTHYLDCRDTPPTLHTAFFDIEVNFHTERGFAPTDDPFNSITAITAYLDWSDELITFVIAPKTVTHQTAKDIVAQFPNTTLYTDERLMLKDFMTCIEDADVLSGWNSEGYDIPYTINRIIKVLSKHDTRRFCLWQRYPVKRKYEKYGAEAETYDLVGRVHLDYMQLYQKYTYHEMHSYALNAIAEYELGEQKVAYVGTLDDLYKKDFKLFIEYNRQDTMLLNKLDKKLKFIDLANAIAHANTVLIPKTSGAVAVTEQAVINEIHKRGFIVYDRIHISEEEDTSAAGAYVAYPKKGLHKWIGSVDINSLYPSAIRSLNMSPETIIGQLRPIMTDIYIADKMDDTKNKKGKTVKGGSFADAWEDMFGTLEYQALMDRSNTVLTIDWQDGGSEQHTAKTLHDVIFNKDTKWCVSANGTIFTLEKDGIIPGLLERWYAERQIMQKKKRDATDPVVIAYWDKMQLVKKILLNSLYGALLNQHCRFFDKRIGQSTTLTGRVIVKHMNSHVNECLTGVYDHVGECSIYSDTDSNYFSAWPILKDQVQSSEQEWNVDIATQLYDQLADEVNVSFPTMMEQSFHTTQEKGKIIKCGREVVAKTGLFITKKRYALLVVDNEGTKYKDGKIKAMGLDLKRSDTPPVIQDFLKDILDTTLKLADKNVVIQQIIDFKHKFEEIDPWLKGSPKRINNLTKYTALEIHSLDTEGKSARLPGHVRAGMNYNNLRDMHNDNTSMPITDGTKAIICKLKANPLGLTSIARPTDEANIPKWFTDLTFDNAVMAESQIDKKVSNLLGVLNWDLASETNIKNTFKDLFEF